MAHETLIREDPQNYRPRNVFGSFDRRTALTGAAVLVVATPVVINAATSGWPEEVIGALMILIGAPIALLGCAKLRGLYFEKWAPLLMKERRRPAEMDWTYPALTTQGGTKPRPTRSQRRTTRADAKARRHESELQVGALEISMTDSENGDTDV